MALAAGSRIGPYEIVAAIGAGGMGEVYRARDSKLARDVALKVLPAEFALDPDRIARFRREAQVLASLNHQNIAGIYGFEEGSADVVSGFSRTMHALVLEFVDGPTLADCIAQGPLPLDEALPIAKQIAEALEAAHEQGIIHRDLKPANIKVRPDGTVKVLDFGLAKLIERTEGPPKGGHYLQDGRSVRLPWPEPGRGQPDLTASPTITTPAMTMAGVILGTAAYMSPEHAKGKPADKRSDLWAFGCVLYEMLTGRRAFEGEDVSDTFAAVLRAEPDWLALPNETSASVVTFLKRCVLKDARHRVADVSVALYVLREATAERPPARERAKAGVPSRRVAAIAVTGVIAGVIATAITGWIAGRMRPTEAPRVTRFTIVPPQDKPLIVQGHDVAVSPDGSLMVYPAGAGPGELMIRAMNQLEARPLGAVGGRWPFFSPDGQWVGFFDGTGLKKISIAGGPATTLARFTGTARGASWGRDNTIVFASVGAEAGLMSVSAMGGEPPKMLTKPDTAHGEADHWFPSLLPNGRGVLLTIVYPGQSDKGKVAVFDFATSQIKPLVDGARAAHYVESGYLVYGGADAIRAVRFDPEKLEVVGQSSAIVDQVIRTAGGISDFALSPQGTLAYVPEIAAARRTPVWVDRQGLEEPINVPPRTYTGVRLSPDMTRIALGTGDGPDATDGGLWVWDLAREAPTRVTDERVQGFVWTPDSQRIIFSPTSSTSVPTPSWKNADGSGTAHRLTTSIDSPAFPTSISSDGRLFLTQTGTGSLMISTLAFGTSGGPTNNQTSPVLQSSSGSSPEISPDGRFLAYQSSESGQPEVYVRPYPDVDSHKWTISTGGGSRPAWARDGQELFYLDDSGRLMSVLVHTAGAAFIPAKPRRILDKRYFVQSIGARTYDVAGDGQRFLMIKDDDGAEKRTPTIVVVEHWLEELKQRIPVK